MTNPFHEVFARTAGDLYHPFLTNGIEFIQVHINEDKKIEYVVASSAEEVKRILEQEGNQGYSEWHSDDIELIGFNNLLEDPNQITFSQEFKRIYSATPFPDILGECTFRITKEGIVFIE